MNMDMDHGTIERLFWQQMRQWTVKTALPAQASKMYDKVYG
ncbi:MAG: hypothetical protein AABX70_01300 [Nanoarchaeota archaeon]